MASISAFTVGRVAKYVAESSFKNFRSQIYSTNYRFYSNEKLKDNKGDVEKPPPTLTLVDCQKQIETLTNELNEAKILVKEYEDKYKRALADGENVRRRMGKQVDDAKSYAIQSFCKDLLDVADTLAAAAESVPESSLSGAGEGTAALRSLHDGVRLTRAMLTQVFSRHGLSVVSPLREKFDPNLHEALFQQEVEGSEPGTVVAVSKVGYKLNDRCVRPALVGVAKGPAS